MIKAAKPTLDNSILDSCLEKALQPSTHYRFHHRTISIAPIAECNEVGGKICQPPKSGQRTTRKYKAQKSLTKRSLRRRMTGRNHATPYKKTRTPPPSMTEAEKKACFDRFMTFLLPTLFSHQDQTTDDKSALPRRATPLTATPLRDTFTELNTIVEDLNDAVSHKTMQRLLFSLTDTPEMIYTRVGWLRQGIVSYHLDVPAHHHFLHPLLSSQSLNRVEQLWFDRLSPEQKSGAIRGLFDTGYTEIRPQCLISAWMKRPPLKGQQEEINGKVCRQQEIRILINRQQKSTLMTDDVTSPTLYPMRLGLTGQCYEAIPARKDARLETNDFKDCGTIKFTAEDTLLGILDPLRSQRLKNWFADQAPEHPVCWDFVEQIQFGKMSLKDSMPILHTASYTQIKNHLGVLPFFYPIYLIAEGKPTHAAFYLGHDLIFSLTGPCLMAQQLPDAIAYYDGATQKQNHIGIIRCEDWPNWDSESWEDC
ncbi:hypothetical protein [Parendozoicomonas haliclonae]|uniref:Uncharacterized protein n=1 Tax=Parendozoicomonas haliclonae TaxID=1960125 RepID=A0A1X7AMA8_9GAMM|nr:hypothetical protein [Parendozoicomonas haliclonae]SMA49052.1 hypothetical protein EHSB41UT_03020 [Parendozoicomonas haliclonae]